MLPIPAWCLEDKSFSVLLTLVSLIAAVKEHVLNIWAEEMTLDRKLRLMIVTVSIVVVSLTHSWSLNKYLLIA